MFEPKKTKTKRDGARVKDCISSWVTFPLPRRSGLEEGRSGLKGQSLIELALITPAVLLVIMIIVYFGMMLDTCSKLDAVARETTHIIAKNPDGDGVTMGLARAREVAQQFGLDTSKLVVTISGDTSSRGGFVVAQVQYTFQLFGHSSTGFGAVTLRASQREVIECWRGRSDDSAGGSCEPAA